MSLALAFFVISSSGLLVDDGAGLGARGAAATKDASIEDALRSGARNVTKARKALALVITSEAATPVQTWRALRQVGKQDPAVQARLDQMFPALPFVEGTGAQARALRGAFEEALLDTGALPITADPARRRGELKVKWTMRQADDDRTTDRSWSIEAKAVLLGKDGRLTKAQTKTLVAGASAEKAAQAGMPVAAGELVQALLVSLAKESGLGSTASALRASPRTVEKVAALRERAADGDKKSRAVLEAFPANVIVDVKGPGDTRVWARSIEGALMGVSQGALPLTTETADHTMRVRVVVEEAGGSKVLAAGVLRRYTLKATAAFVYDGTQVLAEITKVGGAMGSTPEEAAAAASEKTARALYDAMFDEVAALRHRTRS